MRKVLVIYQSRSSFVRRDIDILSKQYIVEEFAVPDNSKIIVLLNMIRMFVKLLFGFNKYYFVMAQGAGFHSLPAALLSNFKGFKMVIVAIGMDCAKIPEINYGNFRKPQLAKATATSFRKADLIIPVHESLVEKEIAYIELNFPKQGIKNLVPGISTKIIAVHNGYDSKKWLITKAQNLRKKSFLSVAANLNEKTFKLKGFDLIFDLANQLSDESFSLVGTYSGKKPVPPNVTFINNMDQNELIELYNEHRFYLQLSISEGFPNALCEAMLCGCIPIVSDIGAMPDIVGSEGYILKKHDIEMLLTLTKEVIQKPISLHPSERISKRFPLNKRSREMFDVLSDNL